MIEPSFNLGDGNWAGKPGNLLGYHKISDKFYADELTFTRASSGTIVNAEGLIETAAILGSEQVTNGDFSNGTTGWSPEYSASISVVNSQLEITGSVTGGGRTAQGVTTTIGASYVLKATITNVNSSGILIKISQNSNLDGAYFNSASNTTTNPVEITHTFIATSATTYIGTNQSGSSYSTTFIDNVSVKEVTTSNIPRVDYLNNTNGSLLLEPQRTNLITHSEDFSSGNWGLTDYSSGAGAPIISSTSIISPDGTPNATQIDYPETTGSEQSVLKYDYVSGASVGVDYTISVYLKSTSNCTIISRDAANVENAINVTTEWQRFDFTAAAAGSNIQIKIGLRPSSGSQTDACSVHIYGAQVEEGSYATSIIPTSGTTVTRNSDTCATTGLSNTIGQTEGTIFVEAMFSSGYDSNNLLITLSDAIGNGANLMYINRNNGKLEFFVQSASVTQMIYVAPTILSAGVHKIALGYKANDFVVYIDGVLAYTDTSGSVPAFSKLNLGSYYNESLTYNNGINQAQLYKTRLTNAEIATLTT